MTDEPGRPPAVPQRDLDLATAVVEIVSGVLGEALIAAYLHGSAVLGGLRPTSDLDMLAVVDRPTTDAERQTIVHDLLEISGRRARRGPARPVELSIVVQSEVLPWRPGPRVELLYGEWLRDDFERGGVPEPRRMDDLGPEITTALAGNVTLFGPPASQVLDPVPPADLRRAIVAGVPSLLADAETDTRNVLLTLARIWATLATGAIHAKDEAAAWAMQRLPPRDRESLIRAREMYLAGRDEEHWAERWPEAQATALALVDEIRHAQHDERSW